MYLSTLDTLFENHLSEGFPFSTRSNVRIKDTDNGTGIILEVHGVNPQDVSISVINRVLEARINSINDWGEKLQIKKNYRLSQNHDAKSIKAQLTEGILKLFIPKIKESTDVIEVKINQTDSNIFKDLNA